MFSKVAKMNQGDCILFTSMETCYACKPAVKEMIALYPNNNFEVFCLQNGIIKKLDPSLF